MITARFIRPLSSLVSAASLFTAIGFCAAPRTAHAQVLGQFNVNGLNGQPASAPASSVAAGLTFSDLTRGPGLTVPAATNNAFNSSGFNNTTGTLDVSNNDFITFTVTNNSPATQTVTFSSINLATQRSGTGPATVALLSSLTGFTNADAIATIAPGNGTTTTDTITLGGLSFTAVPNATVEFRLYGFQASATGGTFRISGTTTPPGLVVNGTVNPIVTSAAPEPGSLALFALSGLPVAIAAVRRRRGIR
jgi:hypothetical protein